MNLANPVEALDLKATDFTKKASLSLRCVVRGISIDYRIQKTIDTYFKGIDFFESGAIAWKLKDGVTAKAAVEEINSLNITIHEKTLLPSVDAANAAEGFDEIEGPRLGYAVLRVPLSQGKNHTEMEQFLGEQGMSLSSRYNSIVSLNLNLLLTGEHLLEKNAEIRDAKGVLFSYELGMSSSDHEEDRSLSGYRLWALGSCKN